MIKICAKYQSHNVVSSQSSTMSIGEASLFEKKHVTDIYDTISTRFDQTRHVSNVWPNVAEFINNLPYGSKLLEVGCGNGRNITNIRDDIIATGIDSSKELIKHGGDNLLYGDARSLPFPDNSFDAVMSIAVIHHISTVEGRKRAMDEMLRVCKPGGQIYAQVWAHSASFFSGKRASKFRDIGRETGIERDFMVKFGGHERYYHLFDSADFMEMILPYRENMTEIDFVKHNWTIKLTK